MFGCVVEAATVTIFYGTGLTEELGGPGIGTIITWFAINAEDLEEQH